MDEQGLAALTLTRVAGKANVSAGRVQHYFPTRTALLEATFEHANAASSARIEQRLRAEKVAPGLATIEVVLDELIPYDAARTTHLRVRQAFTALALTDESIRDRLATDYAQLTDRLGEHAQQGLCAVDLISLIAHAEGLAYHVLIGSIDAEHARGLLRGHLHRAAPSATPGGSERVGELVPKLSTRTARHAP